MINRCPCCGNQYMKFRMSYQCGTPIVRYVCDLCGYDTAKNQLFIVTTHPNYDETKTKRGY